MTGRKSRSRATDKLCKWRRLRRDWRELWRLVAGAIAGETSPRKAMLPVPECAMRSVSEQKPYSELPRRDDVIVLELAALPALLAVERDVAALLANANPPRVVAPLVDPCDLREASVGDDDV